MELGEILDENIIVIGLDVSSKEEVLRKLSKVLKREQYINDVDEFVKDIYLREEEGITGIGNGVAIPHGKSDSVSKIGIAIAKLLHPIPWESLDGNEVDLVFLFCVSSDVNFAQNHMRMLSRVAGKIGNDELLMNIKNSKTPREIIDMMAEEAV